MSQTRPRSAQPASGLATQYAPPLDLPLRFLATAVGGLALLVVVYPWHLPLLLGSFLDPHLLTFVHVNTLGVIGATIFGASYQLLPVVVQAPLAWVRLARFTWWLYLPGLALFALGLAQGWRPATLAGGSLLYAAVALYVAIVWRTLWRAARRDVVVWHVFLATASLALGATLGVMLAHTGGGGLSGGLILPALAAHATLMIGGWVTPMLTGVAYRLVGMFTLSEASLRENWSWLELLLTVGGAWTLAASLLLGLASSLGILGATSLLAGLGLFAAQLGRLYQRRRRRTFDIHIPFALAATFYALLAAALVLGGLATGRGPTDPLWLAAGWLAIAGWAETAIQGFLYKIGTFLTWLHRYAPLAGRRPVPKLEDLYSRRVALAGWAGWTAGVALGALATLSGAGWLAYAAAAALSTGGLAFLLNAARVATHWRTPAVRPAPTPAPTSQSNTL